MKSKLLILFTLLPVLANGQSFSQFSNTPLPGPNEPVLAGYDLVEYHNLKSPSDDGVPGNASISYRHDNGYLYYFVNEDNKQAFMANPEKFLPMYGGFCAWGMAFEWGDQGWPWARNHMGPPCGPRDGWAILDGRLYCSIWRSYQTDFNIKQEQGIRAANARWIDYYGSLTAGPQNNGCYAWNWQECFSRSIYDPSGSSNSNNKVPQSPPVGAPPGPPLPSGFSLFDKDTVSMWSMPQTVLGGDVTWSWTLQDLATSSPKLIVELVATNLPPNSYVAFGVAEQLMQGALVVCAPSTQQDDGSVQARQQQQSPQNNIDSTCQTLLGAGMGTTKPGEEQDPVQPTVLSSYRNETHYTVRFSASLLGCWSRPRLPARVIFARGLVSGNGDPQPHRNDLDHRQAVTGIDLLSVVEGYNVEENRPDVPTLATVEPLADAALWVPVPDTAGATTILDDRVRVAYQLFEHNGEEIVQVQLQNVEFVSEDTYIGFGFAKDVMTGLVITCAPRIDHAIGKVTVTCQQWRGFGTNLYPLYPAEDAGGWFVTAVDDRDGTHISYTLAGRVAEVVQAHGGDSTVPLSAGHVRVICAMGRSAPDSGTPLIHSARDRVGFELNGLARTTPRTADASTGFASSTGFKSGRQQSAVAKLWFVVAATLLLLLSFQ